MPAKIRELVKNPYSARFANRGEKETHRNFKHEHGAKVTVSGKAGDDAKPYQINDVQNAIDEAST